MPGPSKRDFSGESHSTNLPEGIDRALRFSPVSGSPSDASDYPSDILRRILSVRSVDSTSSSFAERINRARTSTADNKSQLRVIGLGSCGTAPDTKALWQDFRLTNLAYNAAFDTRGMLQEAFKDKTIPRIPQCHEFELPGSMDWWKANMERFPREHRTEGAVLLVDRILPLPQRARQALIKLYFEDSEEVQEEAMNDGENKHCLVRVYMGENETLEQQAGSYDSLRNFPLRLNMIEDLELEKAELAEEMAIGLAIIHWQAQVDAMDVEFVIGSAATTGGEESRADTRDTPPRQVRSINFKRRSTHLWILDFDKASEIQLTTEDVDKKLVPAFLGNDSYYPRPNIDEELWTSFCGTYLKASRLILESRMKTRSLELPQRFLDKVVETVKEFEDWDPEEQIVFGD